MFVVHKFFEDYIKMDYRNNHLNGDAAVAANQQHGYETAVAAQSMVYDAFGTGQQLSRR